MESLLDIRDELAVAKNLAAALYLACDARSMPGDQGAALCELSNLVLGRLTAIIVALDSVIASCAKRGEAGSD